MCVPGSSLSVSVPWKNQQNQFLYMETDVPGSIRPSTNRNTEKKPQYFEFRYLQLASGAGFH